MVELIAVAKTFGQRPSNLLHGLSSYEAYCFDVACTVYVVELEKGKKPSRNMGDATTWL